MLQSARVLKVTSLGIIKYQSVFLDSIVVLVDLGKLLDIQSSERLLCNVLHADVRLYKWTGLGINQELY